MISNKNVNLQLTISKEDNEQLSKIQSELTTLLNVDFTKSQTITFLIRNYGKSQLKSVNLNKAKTDQKDTTYKVQLITLKERLNKTYGQLAELIGIPESTLKKYAQGIQEPKDNNRKLLDNFLSKYGVE